MPSMRETAVHIKNADGVSSNVMMDSNILSPLFLAVIVFCYMLRVARTVF